VEAGLLHPLDQDERRMLIEAGRRRKFARGEVVFHDGDPGDSLHLVVRGHFAIRIGTPLGDVATLRVVGPGAHFGELAVLSPAPRRGSVVALEGGETLSLHRDDFVRLRATIPKIDEVLIEALVAEVRRLADALVDALYVPVEQRIWRRLHELVELYGRDVPVVIPITQDDLAQLAGTTRSSANRVLRPAADDDLIRLARGRIEVLDVDALSRLAR
jgi:CRP-like cAMP-binding protein